MSTIEPVPDVSSWSPLPPPDAERLGVFTQFAQAIAHDVNNFMAVIVGHNNLLRRRLPTDHADLAEHTRQIAEAGDEILGLTRQLALYVGRAPYEESVTDGAELCAAATAPCQLPTGLRLHNLIAPGTTACRGDRAQLTDLLTALIRNAVEAHRNRPGQVWVRASETDCDSACVERHRLDRRTVPGRFTRIEVIDNGCGIAPAIAPRLFDPTFSTQIRARGMGLPVVLGVARAHRGFVIVRTQAEAGSAFQVYLPVAARGR